GRILDTHASVAEVAPCAGKQVVPERIVQVHVLRIGKDELHQAERVAGSGALTQAEFSGTEPLQVCSARLDGTCIVTGSADDLHLLVRQIVWIATDGRQ